MTRTRQIPARFPLSSALAWLMACALLVMAVGGAVFQWAYPASVDAGLSLLLLVGINTVTASLGLVLVSAVAAQGSMVVSMAYFLGASVRFIFNLLAVGYLAAVREGDILTIFIALALAYLPMLLVEVGLVGAYLWRLDEANQASSSADSSITEAVA